MSKKVEALNQFIQKKLLELEYKEVSAVEMAKYLDEAGILKDNKSRPGLPLRNYLRSNSIIGGYQNASKRWFIKKIENNDDYISVATAARILNVSEPAIYKKIERMEIKPKTIGRNRYLISKSEIEAILRRQDNLHIIKHEETIFSFVQNLKQQVSEIKEDVDKVMKKLNYLESKIKDFETIEAKTTSFKIKLKVGNDNVDTLDDILPKEPGLKILFIAKTPAPVSVRAGHYFQGKQGKMLWNKLREYNIFNPPEDKFEDEYLLDYQYGITDIVKVPHDFGNEPSSLDYKTGLQRILNLIKTHNPKVVFFIYKKVLDNILKFGFNISQKSKYGFNKDLEALFNCKVFVFPMPGTPCNASEAHKAMYELQQFLNV